MLRFYVVDENGVETEKIKGQVFLWEMYPLYLK